MPVPSASTETESPPAWSRRLLAELAASNGRATQLAGDLSPQQLNWRANERSWSIAQCLEHLRVAGELYLPAIEAALNGRQVRPVDEIRVPWLSRWFIRNYIAPNPGGARAQAPAAIAPAEQVSPRILDEFLRSNEAAVELVRRASRYDVNRIRFKNPFIPLLRFTVGTGLEILAQHEARHLLQAEGVRKAPGFPGA